MATGSGFFFVDSRTGEAIDMQFDQQKYGHVVDVCRAKTKIQVLCRVPGKADMFLYTLRVGSANELKKLEGRLTHKETEAALAGIRIRPYTGMPEPALPQPVYPWGQPEQAGIESQNKTDNDQKKKEVVEQKKDDAKAKKADAKAKQEEAKAKKEEAKAKKGEAKPKKEDAKAKKEEAKAKKDDVKSKKADAKPKKDDDESKVEDAAPKKTGKNKGKKDYSHMFSGDYLRNL